MNLCGCPYDLDKNQIRNQCLILVPLRSEQESRLHPKWLHHFLREK